MLSLSMLPKQRPITSERWCPAAQTDVSAPEGSQRGQPPTPFCGARTSTSVGPGSAGQWGRPGLRSHPGDGRGPLRTGRAGRTPLGLPSGWGLKPTEELHQQDGFPALVSASLRELREHTACVQRPHALLRGGQNPHLPELPGVRCLRPAWGSAVRLLPLSGPPHPAGSTTASSVQSSGTRTCAEFPGTSRGLTRGTRLVITQAISTSAADPTPGRRHPHAPRPALSTTERKAPLPQPATPPAGPGRRSGSTGAARGTTPRPGAPTSARPRCVCPGRPRHSPSEGTRPKAAAASPASGRRSMRAAAAAAPPPAGLRHCAAPARRRPRKSTSWTRAGPPQSEGVRVIARRRRRPCPQACHQRRATQRSRMTSRRCSWRTGRSVRRGRVCCPGPFPSRLASGGRDADIRRCSGAQAGRQVGAGRRGVAGCQGLSQTGGPGPAVSRRPSRATGWGASTCLSPSLSFSRGIASAGGGRPADALPTQTRDPGREGSLPGVHMSDVLGRCSSFSVLARHRADISADAFRGSALSNGSPGSRLSCHPDIPIRCGK